MKDLTKGNISKNLWLLAIPTVAAELFSYALSTVDKVMLGKIVGDVGLAAVGVTESYFGILWGLYGALTSAFGAQLAYLWGKGDGGCIKRTYKINMRINLIVGVVIAVGSILLWRPLFAYLKVPADVFDEAKRYYIVYAATFFVFVLKGNLGAALLSLGDSVFPMRVSMISAACNVALNYVLIVFCKMGAVGAAIATLLVSVGGCAAYWFKLRADLATTGGEVGRATLAEYHPILKQAIPTALQQMMMYLFAFAVQPSINTLGKTAIAAIAVGESVGGLITIGYNQLSKGMSIFVGQALGHKKPSLVRKGLLLTVRHILMLTVPLILLLVIFPRIVPFIFLTDPYGEAAAISIQYIYCCVPFMLALAFNRMFHNFFRGVLRPGFNIAGGLAMGVTRAVLSISLIPVIGAYGAFIGYSAAWTADCLVMLIVYLSKKWKTKEYIELELLERKAVATFIES